MDTEEPPVTGKVARVAYARLKQERERRGWSQSELAERLSTTQVNVSRWETGITTPGPFFRQRLADVFGKSLEELGLIAEAVNTAHLKSEAQGTGPDTSASAIQYVQRWNIPYPRNPYFTGREDILLYLYTILNTNNTAALTQTQAICGLGGIGKTQIAVEYAYRYRDCYSAVLWTSASSRDILIADIVTLAALLGLPEHDEQAQDIIISAVKRWLASNTNWLLILDNVEDLQIILEFLPTKSMGKVLLTTRLQALGSVAQGIEVEKMGMDEGMLFLLRRTRILASDAPLEHSRKHHQAHAAEIVTELGALPLALDQAGAYIEETRCGLSGYLALYRTRRTEMLRRRGKLPMDHPEPVATTWSLSFHQIEQNHAAAADLLRLLAFFSPESIPEEILTDGAAELGPTLSSEVGDPLQFNDIIELLLHYSLIQRNSEERSLNIHRLVQAVLKDGMSKELARAWAERAIRAINWAFPEVKLTTWDQCQRCLPHAVLSMTLLKEYDLAFQEAADLLNKAAAYLITHARYTQAEPLLQETLKIRQEKLGSKHPDTATSLNNMARLYHAQGRYIQAETLYQHVLHIRKQILESNHPDIARSLNYLAELYTDQGKYTQAKVIYKEALDIQKRVLGSHHPDVAQILNNLALVHRKTAEYAQAERLYLEALDIQEQVLIKNHPDKAETLNNLGRLYRAMGEYTRAEPFYQDALAIREKVFAPNHRLVGESHYSLAKIYRSLGKYDKAEEYGEEALRIQEQQLGENHPEIASTLDVLAYIYQKRGKHDKAKKLYQRAWEIRERSSGSDHPHLAIILNNLAEIFLAQGDYSEARKLIDRSINIRERRLGRDHPYLAYSLSTLAENYFMLGDYIQAEILYKEALVIREKNLGSDHPLTASSYNNLAKLYASMQRYEDAEPLYLKALAIREQTLSEHPDFADTLMYYAKLLRATGRDGQAFKFEKNAQTILAKQAWAEAP